MGRFSTRFLEEDNMSKCAECGKHMILSSPVAQHGDYKFCSEACVKRWLRGHAQSDGSGSSSCDSCGGGD